MENVFASHRTVLQVKWSAWWLGEPCPLRGSFEKATFFLNLDFITKLSVKAPTLTNFI